MKKPKKNTIKKDFNLLPHKEGPSNLVRYGIPSAIYAVAMCCMLLAGILIPRQIIASRKAKKDKLMAEIQSMQNVQKEYNSLNEQVNMIQNQLKSLDTFTGEKRTLQGLLDLFENSSPTGISLLNAECDYEKVILSGTSVNDAAIAAFTVKLRESGLFAKEQLDIVRDAAANSEGTFAPGSRYFKLSLYYPVKAPAKTASGSQAKGSGS